jgi:flagellar motor protein MotB
MSVARLALLVTLIGVVALSGCRTRSNYRQDDVVRDEQRAELARLSTELDRLSSEYDALRRQRDEALADRQSVGAQLSGILRGGEIEGIYQTDTGSIALDEDFFFAKGSADLNESARKSLGQLASRLTAGDYANARIIVEGHTDDTPVSRAATKEKYGDNWGLSAARSATVVRELQKSGVAATRLHGAFRGEHAPRGSDKAKNRRVELYIK